MAIKAGQFLHVANNGFVVDRIQTGGVSSLNIPEEKIYELGNYQSVSTIRDVPDLSFDMESFDTSTEIEALLRGVDPTTLVDGDNVDLLKTMPVDIVSPFKSGAGAFDIVKGIAVPYLTLESLSYSFGVGQNSSVSTTLRGDSIYYTPGTPRVQQWSVSGAGPYTFANTAIVYVEGGENIYALSVCLINATTGAYKRLFFGTDYTNTSGGFTLAEVPDGAYTHVRAVYATAAATSYLQTVHQGTAVKPAAVRGKDIEVWIGNGAATPTYTKWTSIQSVDLTWSVTLERDEELGNSKVYAQDYDVPDVSGSVTIKPRDNEDLWDKIAQISNVATNVVSGPFSSIPLQMQVRIKDPDTGDALKTLYVPDARFTPPATQGTVQQKLTVTFPFSSDGGTLEVYKGLM